MTKQSFLQGTFILILAGFITKVLGFVNRIVVARIMGAEGVGLYMMAIPTLLLVITITQIGLPVAISKLVAEAEAHNNGKKVKQILVVSLATTGILSVIFTIGMIGFAPIIAKYFLTDTRAFFPLVAISPIVPIVALSSVLRGYFQGKQNMKPSAYSQVIEQVVRITLVAVLTSTLLPYGVEYAAAGAMISVVFGELASLIYMALMFKLKKKIKVRRNFFGTLKEGKSTFQQLMAVALPTTGSRLIGSISLFLEPIVVSQSLAIAGVTTIMATKQYGELAGFAIPLLFLPTFITYSLSVSLVPAISEAAANRHYKLINHRLSQALRLALVSGGVSCVILYVFAVPIMDLMYNAPTVATYLKIMAPFSIFLYFQGPLQAALQALNLAKAAMMNSIIGAVVKITLVFVLTSRPEFGIMGAALAVVAGFMLVTILHFATLVKTISYTLDLREFLKAIICILVSGWLAALLYNNAFNNLSLLPKTLFSISIIGVIYIILLMLFGLIKKEEMRRVPLIGKWLSRFIISKI